MAGHSPYWLVWMHVLVSLYVCDKFLLVLSVMVSCVVLCLNSCNVGFHHACSRRLASRLLTAFFSISVASLLIFVYSSSVQDSNLRALKMMSCPVVDAAS